MQQTSIGEACVSALLLLVAAVIGASLMPSGGGLVNLVYFTVPMIILYGLAHLTSSGPGWVGGSSVAFAIVAILETFWEQRLYTGPNSMPGFVYLFLCAPLAIFGLLIACTVRRWLKTAAVRGTLAALFVFLFGGVPVFFGLIGK